MFRFPKTGRPLFSRKAAVRNIARLSGVLTLFFIAAGPASALSLELLYPADGTHVVKSDYLIIRGSENPMFDGISIEINGVKSEVFDLSGAEYRQAFGEFLIVQPEFDPGVNNIVIEGYLAGKSEARAVARVYFHKDHLIAPPEDFRAEAVHRPEFEAKCIRCHNMEPTPGALAGVAAPANPCAGCHARMLDRNHVHGPAGVYQCTYCHEEGSKPTKYRVKPQPDVELCGDCHSDKVEEYRKSPFVHGPIEAGMCMICHDPHATDNIAQLNQPVNELCLGCHAGVDTKVHVLRGLSSGKSHPLGGGNDPSAPGKLFSCASCHNPHGGKSGKLFVRGVEDRLELCRLCHQK